MSTFKIHNEAILQGGTHIGDGTNYTQAASDGRLTMAGTARVLKEIWVPATDFFTNSGSGTGGGMLFEAGSMLSACMVVAVGASVFANTVAASLGFPVIQPNVNATASHTWANALFPVPTDAATSGSVQVRPVWTSHDTNATTGCVFAIKAAIAYISASAAVRTAASTGACPSYNYTASGVFHETSLGNLPSFSSSDVAGILTISHDQGASEDTAGSGIAFLGVKLRYVSDSLGDQSS